MRGSGFTEVVIEADRRGLPFLGVDAFARWTKAESGRAGRLRVELARRLDALAVRGSGRQILLGFPGRLAAATTLQLRFEGATCSLHQRHAGADPRR